MKLAVCTMLLGAAMAAGAQDKAPPAGAGRPVLVELFTSEGCSDCPPADALLRQLDGTVTAAGQTIVVLSEHVTYWNRLGWTDPFSQDIFTERQEAYAQRLRLDSAYTPQAVVNGARNVLGSDRNAMLRAIAGETGASSGATAPTLAIQSAVQDKSGVQDKGAVQVTFALGGDVARSGLEVFAAVAENQTMSRVARGENGGRTLTHVAVARTLIKVATMKADGTMSVTVPLGMVPTGAAKHLVLFAQEPHQGRVVSVATAPL